MNATDYRSAPAAPYRLTYGFRNQGPPRTEEFWNREAALAKQKRLTDSYGTRLAIATVTEESRSGSVVLRQYRPENFRARLWPSGNRF